MARLRKEGAAAGLRRRHGPLFQSADRRAIGYARDSPAIRQRLRARLTEEGAEALHRELPGAIRRRRRACNPAMGSVSCVRWSNRGHGKADRILPAEPWAGEHRPGARAEDRRIAGAAASSCRIDRRFETMLARGAVEEVRRASRASPSSGDAGDEGDRRPKIAAMLKAR